MIELKSDYFRIEIVSYNDPHETFFELKSDYFRIEIYYRKIKKFLDW